nr:immunoglobulin heavy chain junction region [Mus musculus]
CITVQDSMVTPYITMLW